MATSRQLAGPASTTWISSARWYIYDPRGLGDDAVTARVPGETT